MPVDAAGRVVPVSGTALYVSTRPLGDATSLWRGGNTPKQGSLSRYISRIPRSATEAQASGPVEDVIAHRVESGDQVAAWMASRLFALGWTRLIRIWVYGSAGFSNWRRLMAQGLSLEAAEKGKGV